MKQPSSRAHTTSSPWLCGLASSVCGLVYHSLTRWFKTTNRLTRACKGTWMMLSKKSLTIKGPLKVPSQATALSPASKQWALARVRSTAVSSTRWRLPRARSSFLKLMVEERKAQMMTAPVRRRAIRAPLSISRSSLILLRPTQAKIGWSITGVKAAHQMLPHRPIPWK